MKIHSITDLITNSSTTIYTYSKGTDKALRELINEIFKVLGSDKTCDDVFNLVVLYYEWYHYSAAMEDNDDFIPEGWDPEEVDFDEKVEETYKAVIAGQQPKPDWMTKIEENYTNDYSCRRYTTNLFVVAKSPEFEEIGKKALAFLNSQTQDAAYEG